MWSYWAPGHSATLSTLAPESVPCQCPPASPQALQRWRISSRDRANPGTGVGRHPTSEEHLDSPSRARTRSPARRLDKPLAARPSCGKLLSALRPLWRGRPDATSTQQVGRAYPSHPTLLSVGGCKRGSTPRSSYTTPSTLPREEGASSFSRTGGTAGWLLNLRPGTRGYGLLRRPADQRAGCPGHASPLSDPRQGVCSLRGQPPQSYPAVRLPASRWSTYPAFHEATRASTMGRSHSRIMDDPGGKASSRTLPCVTGSSDCQRPSQPTRVRNLRHGRFRTHLQPTHSRLDT